MAARTFAALHEQQIPVGFITQASSEHSITFAIGGDHADAAAHALRRSFREQIARHEIDDVTIQRGMAAVAVVGLGMAGARGVAARVFSAVAQAGVNIVAIAQGSSELNISFVVAEGAAAIAQRAIHAAFQMGREGGGVVLPERRVDVALLGFGQVGRALVGMLVSAQRRGVPFRVIAVCDRSGAVIAPEGLSPPKLASLRTRKAKGQSLATAPGGQALSPEAAVAELLRYAYESPVIVDLTAADTTSLLRTAAEAGMHVILANKRPLTERRADADALMHTVAARGRQLRFEATVGAGLPVMDTCRKLHDAADRIRRIDGCLSGTLGFVLDEVSRGRSFSAAVREAMRRGFT
ncbi:MAG: ACT domain-containing protein, partial [Gemmatimonadetes bacterium]|nr:ACT domain-containing protein [Gemmatimonadota bacterium]